VTDLEEREWRGLNRFDATASMDEADSDPPLCCAGSPCRSGHGRRAYADPESGRNGHNCEPKQWMRTGTDNMAGKVLPRWQHAHYHGGKQRSGRLPTITATKPLFC
jgi:hypothetical protein